ncbi:hypothetical protein M011DRAFT_144726 [Sporormia fimetaria CBS 119925]|uniref:F-box domain-containing protein n=1 Tax=Sporormia fimetaria CBS 119925 TaxID=1340428 RepID=A0A6A6V601_9PLEO|nr:hypothetical protein M011DRAFT_144726 [Sporormia fimetaria CBS 119925]
MGDPGENAGSREMPQAGQISDFEEETGAAEASSSGQQTSANPATRFAHYATISESWKNAIETFTFRKLSISEDELTDVANIMTGRRRSYLVHLTFECKNNRDYKSLKDETEGFFRAVEFLIGLLKSWQDDGVQNQLKLKLKFRTRRHKTLRPGQLGFRRPLPVLSNLHKLCVQGDNSRCILLAEFAALQPNLQHLNLVFTDWYRYSLTLRDVYRVAFAETLARIQLQRQPTARLTIDMCHARETTEFRSRQIVITPERLYDPCSAAIRSCSLNLTSLRVNAFLDSTIFWPHEKEPNARSPFWPHLRTLEIMFSGLSPSGERYFQDISDRFYGRRMRGVISDGRQIPIPELLDPFMASFAKAVRSMPSIDQFRLMSSFPWDGAANAFCVSYCAPGIRTVKCMHTYPCLARDRTVEELRQYRGYIGRCFDRKLESDEELLFRRLTYDVFTGWSPSEEVAWSLRCAGQEKYGGRLIETFRSQWERKKTVEYFDPEDLLEDGRPAKRAKKC